MNTNKKHSNSSKSGNPDPVNPKTLFGPSEYFVCQSFIRAAKGKYKISETEALQAFLHCLEFKLIVPAKTVGLEPGIQAYLISSEPK